jgi:predicted Zn-dependent protease
LGIDALDRLIKHYLTTRNVARAIDVLEDLTESEPESIALRARLAQLYLNLGERDKALLHLDVLGDLQLDAGHIDAALRTLEAILALNPPNRNVYENLYQDITEQEPPPATQS